ncbi:hypothetical protein, partial [Mesorhizobium sp. M0768]|uniref:hypothetical protein n=1 Tax=Mesorhizobium sp. M0768 TaxID=2956996 RepID=UPI00333AC6F9
RQSNSSLIRPDTVPDSKAIRRKPPRQRAAKIALTDILNAMPAGHHPQRSRQRQSPLVSADQAGRAL